MIYLPRQEAIIASIYEELQNLFSGPYWKARDRFSITCDLQVYSKDIEEIAKQKDGVNTYTVFMDQEFVCNFTDAVPKVVVMKIIYKNLFDMYQSGKIEFDIYQKQRKEELKKKKKEEEKKKSFEIFDKDRKNADLSRLNDDEKEIFQEFSDQKRKEL